MTQPIEMRMNEMISGVRSDVAAILYGDDFDILVAKAREIEQVLSRRFPEQPTSAPSKSRDSRSWKYESSKTKSPATASRPIRCWILIESLGSKHVGEVYEGQLRFPLVVRLPEKARADAEAIKAILVATPSGERIPLVAPRHSRNCR